MEMKESTLNSHQMFSTSYMLTIIYIWDKVFKSELSKFCGRQPFTQV